MIASCRFNTLIAQRHLRAILATLEESPKTMAEIADATNIGRKMLTLYIRHLKREDDKRIHICGGKWIPGSRKAPVYAIGGLPDVALSARVFGERTQPQDQATVPTGAIPSRLADPWLAWIPQRCDYLEAA
jgi:hypothetical protein